MVLHAEKGLVRAGTPDLTLFHQAIIVIDVTIAVTVAIINMYHHQPDENQCQTYSNSCSGLLSSLLRWSAKPSTPFSHSSGGYLSKKNPTRLLSHHQLYPRGSLSGNNCTIYTWGLSPYDSIIVPLYHHLTLYHYLILYHYLSLYHHIILYHYINLYQGNISFWQQGRSTLPSPG